MNDAPRNLTSQVQVDISSVGVVATVTVTGVLDTTTATALTRHLLKVRTTHPERLVLDLAGLVFVGFAGVKALGGTCKLLERQCPVILRSPRPSARKVFGRAT